ncbi:MAG TPA: hypothetical protein VJY99_06915 [Buttiauxella sp.]|uniref:hypothetical protein n=1 Tax=Buttiauxella sp. TaxID=1972222 RepID=UPI002B4A2635|nr:hypothetical protein [Buttiauxella sp.]HKM96416.1 hypothetical protein [Buttiauxella sp.]
MSKFTVGALDLSKVPLRRCFPDLFHELSLLDYKFHGTNGDTFFILKGDRDTRAEYRMNHDFSSENLPLTVSWHEKLLMSAIIRMKLSSPLLLFSSYNAGLKKACYSPHRVICWPNLCLVN